MKKPLPEVNKPIVKTADLTWLDEFGIVSQKQRGFLIAYSILSNKTAAARAAKTTTKSHYTWMGDPKEEKRYKLAFEAAHRMACDAIDSEIYDQATRGVRTAKWHEGKIVGFEWVKNTTLLIFYAKGLMPDKYKDRIFTEHAGKVTLEQLVAEANKPAEPEVKKT